MSRPGSALYFDALAYAALAATLVAGAAAFVGPLAELAELLYPAAASVAALLLLWRKPALYVGFMWWVWFLTPAVRRLVDFQVGYTQASLVMLTPFLVTGVALVAVLLRLPRLPGAARLPLAFVTAGLLYAYLVGVLNNGVFSATFDLLNWAVPVVGGAYVLTRPHPAVFATVRRTFSWGLLVMGLYGVVQFFYVPPWDGYWMTQALLQDGLNSIGSPEPLEVRVFSTLNAPGPFAVVVMTGLLLVFGGGGAARLPGAAAGFVGFALSAVRSAWGGWLVGFLVVAWSLPLRLRARLLGTLLLLGVVAVPLAALGPVGELFSERLETMTDLEGDVSFNARLALYADLPSFTADNPLGQGLGSTGVATGLGRRETDLQDLDSGVIAVVYTFGVLGTLYFAGGAVFLFGTALLSGLRSRNLGDATYVGVSVAALSQLAFGNAWTGVAGMVLWFFPCLYLASRQEQLSGLPKRSSPPEPEPVLGLLSSPPLDPFGEPERPLFGTGLGRS